MKKILSAAAGLMLLSTPAYITSPSAALAQETTVVADPYRDLALAMTSDESMEQSFRLFIDQAIPQLFLADENFAMLEIACPGTVEIMMDVIEPLMRPAHEHGYVQYRSDLTTLFSENLSSEDANQAAAFYNSELGRKYLVSIRSVRSATGNSDSLARIDAPAKSARKAAVRALLGMEAKERSELLKILRTAEWMEALRKLNPQIKDFQIKLLNTKLRPDNKKQFDSQLSPAIEQHLAACPAIAG